MYVLADVEWVENNQGLISFTQIAMLRVDEKWRLIHHIANDPTNHRALGFEANLK